MNASEILKKTREENIELWVEQGRLKYLSPKGALHEDLRALISANKQNIIRILEKGVNKKSDIYPLTYNQQSLWFLHKLSSKYPSYNVAASCRIVSEVNIDALLVSFEQIVDHHAVLRTTYHLSDEEREPFQKIHNKINIPFKHIDASGWDRNEVKERVESYYQIPFDLENDLLGLKALFPYDVFILVTHDLNSGKIPNIKDFVEKITK